MIIEEVEISSSASKDVAHLAKIIIISGENYYYLSLSTIISISCYSSNS